MLEELKILYETHRWPRYLAWGGFCCIVLFLLWAEGGFPPQAWYLLAQTMGRFPRLWMTNGLAILFPLAALMVLSMMWFVAWCLVLWLGIMLMRRRKLDERQIAWLESRKLALYAHRSALDEHTLLEDTVTTMPKLRLPYKLQALPASDPEQGQTERQRQPVLVSVGQAQPLWRKEHNSHGNGRAMNAVPDIPTTPERSSRGPAMATRIAAQTKLEVGVGWNSGLTRRRQPNEDSLVVLQGTCTYEERLVPFGLFVVADGMGGHDCGREASHIAIQSMMQVVLRDIATSDSLNDEVLTELLISGVGQANAAICRRGKEWGKEMGTTLTAALIVDKKAYIVNVGDSRTYLCDESSGLSQVTLDHSLVASLVIAGAITPEEVYTHPERNKVYRSLGNREGVDVDWFTRELRRGDSLLLCSDGLWEMVRDHDIEWMIRGGKESTQIADELVQAALRGGGVDNVSVIVVRVA